MQPFLKRNKACITLPCNLFKKKQSMYHSAMQPFKKETKMYHFAMQPFKKRNKAYITLPCAPSPTGRDGEGPFFRTSALRFRGS